MSNFTFESIPKGECDLHPTVSPFSSNIHLLFLQCKENGLALAILLLVTSGIKLFQNTLYQRIGQKQRELLQQTREKRAKSALLSLVALEFVAGVIGIVSILVVTGNNAFVWIVIVLSNCLGTAFAFWKAQPDHHSTSQDIMLMLEHYKKLKEEKKKNTQVTATIVTSNVFSIFVVDTTDTPNKKPKDELDSIENTLRSLNEVLDGFNTSTSPTSEEQPVKTHGLRSRLVI